MSSQHSSVHTAHSSLSSTCHPTPADPVSDTPQSPIPNICHPTPLDSVLSENYNDNRLMRCCELTDSSVNRHPALNVTPLSSLTQCNSTGHPLSNTAGSYPHHYSVGHLFENTIKVYTTDLTNVIGNDLTYFSSKFIELGFLTRDSANNILTAHGIGNGEKGNRLLNDVIKNLSISRNKERWFEEFVSVFSPVSAYRDLATSMIEARHNNSVSHIVSESHVAQLSIDPVVVSFINYVKTLYRLKNVETDPTVVKWPHTPSQLYVNLAWINRHSDSAKSMKYAEVTEAMVRDGNVDVILNATKDPIEFDDIAKNIESNERKLILVEGAPGVGNVVLAIIACMISYCGSVSGHVHTVV